SRVLFRSCEATQRRQQPLILQRLAGLRREQRVDLRRAAVLDRVADDGVAGQAEVLGHGIWVSSVSLTKCQVRVMTSISASRAISGGKGRKGAAICTMRRASSVGTACSDGWSTSSLATMLSACTDTVICNVP